MLICKKCGRQTRLGEPTGLFLRFREVRYEEGSSGIEYVNQLKTCINCSGQKEYNEK